MFLYFCVVQWCIKNWGLQITHRFLSTLLYTHTPRAVSKPEILAVVRCQPPFLFFKMNQINIQTIKKNSILWPIGQPIFLSLYIVALVGYKDHEKSMATKWCPCWCQLYIKRKGLMGKWEQQQNSWQIYIFSFLITRLFCFHFPYVGCFNAQRCECRLETHKTNNLRFI